MVQVFINDLDYTNYVRQPSIQWTNTLSDPVPTLQFDLEDPLKAFSFLPWATVVVLDDTQPASPTHNLYVDPLYSTKTNVSNANGTITYNTTAGSASFAVSSPGSPTGTLSLLQPFSNVHVGQLYTFSLSYNIASIAHATVFMQTTLINADGTTASQSTDTFTATTGGTLRYNKTVTIPSNVAFLIVTYGIQNIASNSVCTVVFSHPQMEIQRPGQGISYPTPDCVPGATNCTQLPDLTTVRETRLFGGYSTLQTVDYQSQRVFSFHVSGFAVLLNKTICSIGYGNTADDVVVSSFITNNVPGLTATTASVSSTGYTFDTLNAQNVYAKDVLDSICQQTGAIYWIDAYATLHYQLPGTTPTAFSLSDTPDMVMSFPYYDYSYELDASQMANQLSVLGAQNSQPIIADFVGNGTQYIFTINIALQSIESVSVNGSPTTDYSADLQTGTITLFSTPGNGIPIAVACTRNRYTSALVADVASVGNYGLTLTGQVQDSNLFSSAALAQRGRIELGRYNIPQVVVTLKTNQLLSVGSLVPFFNRDDGLSNVLLQVQQVQTGILGTDETGKQIHEYQGQLGAYRPDFIHQLLFTQRQQLTQGSYLPGDNPQLHELLFEQSTTFSDAVSVHTTTTPFLQGRDTFAGRTVNPGLGTASDGQSWVTNQTTGFPSFQVGSSEGQISGFSASAELYLGTHTGQNVDLRVRFSLFISSPSAGRQVTFGALARSVDNNNRYQAVVTPTQGGSTTVALKKTVSGTTSTVGSATVGPIAYDATFWWMHLRISGTTLTLSVWKDGTMEPSTPTLSLTDSGVSSAGRFGVTATLPAQTTTCKVDNFLVLGI